MTILFFYITGFLTAAFALLFIYQLHRVKEVKKEMLSLKETNKQLLNENKELKLFKVKKTSKQRTAVINWDGWHKTKDPSNKWSVTLTVKEVAHSQKDPDLYQFEIISVISANKNDEWEYKDYNDYFIREYHGGWLNLNKLPKNLNFHWIVTESKEAIRDEKLDELLDN